MIEDGFHDVAPGKLGVVVTHLQMLEKPVLRDASLPDGVTFRQVTPTVDWFRDIFRRVGADWLWYGRLKLDDAALITVLQDPARDFYTLTRDGKDEALLELYFSEEGTCELAYFGLTSALIGSGSGRYLMNQAITLAWEKPIERLHLHTCTNDSPQALGFYVRSGFTPFRRQVEIDDDPRLNGLLPRDAAPQVPLIEG
ncbi:hypothetical protein DSM110093_03266 [Sulfitobacter sp. DSM 110093]|uniref:GNAT family N-acetyltransferase n=1 Tax=Sulfitobacter sp. DSM 110093 TaxID=2883127 RepID=UPI001FADF0AA|nr:GNAT family N-acetyltransferase [Sulfitobacter sp. DSM 110093]UOA33439.1 hypothetical protein DSM110093_03266 [Sulfitobacter sp. DSM 110093]